MFTRYSNKGNAMSIKTLFSNTLIIVCLTLASSNGRAATFGPGQEDQWYLIGYNLGWVNTCNNVKYATLKKLRDEVKSFAKSGQISAVEDNNNKKGYAKFIGDAQSTGCSAESSTEVIGGTRMIFTLVRLQSQKPRSYSSTASKSRNSEEVISDSECSTVGIGRKKVDEVYVSIKYDKSYKSLIKKPLSENRAKNCASINTGVIDHLYKLGGY